MKKIIQLSGFVGGLLAPFSFVFAQDVAGLMYNIMNLLNIFISLLMILAVVYFIYGVVTYVIAKGSDGKEEAKSRVTNGLIGLFIIVSFWGIIRIVQNQFGVDNTVAPDQFESGVPCVYGVNC